MRDTTGGLYLIDVHKKYDRWCSAVGLLWMLHKLGLFNDYNDEGAWKLAERRHEQPKDKAI